MNDQLNFQFDHVFDALLQEACLASQATMNNADWRVAEHNRLWRLVREARDRWNDARKLKQRLTAEATFFDSWAWGEPCPGCGTILNSEGCDLDDSYHGGQGGCAYYENINGWRENINVWRDQIIHARLLFRARFR